eukprot:Unigene7284_Nuclearia_a/m.22372 Unigene7284_Nuclearia_a/g.22372  ORF Unigene7284_Nuclearia_a/g.22372 Unigene7284_Nuclearia_a/m.22372 type:complete len:109 (+) Unigene7284_Nuclearia_a:3-329(+)
MSRASSVGHVEPNKWPRPVQAAVLTGALAGLYVLGYLLYEDYEKRAPERQLAQARRLERTARKEQATRADWERINRTEPRYPPHIALPPHQRPPPYEPSATGRDGAAT